MTSLQMGGVMLGALVAGQLADTFGRRKTLYGTGLLHFVTSFVAAFSVSWQMFIVMRVLIGVSLGLYLVVCFPYPIEFVSPQYRQVLCTL
jgi:MFS family permease